MKGSTEKSRTPLPYTRIFTSVLKLGIPFDELVRMSFSQATMYLIAQQVETVEDSGPRKATQADIDAWI